MSGCGYDATEGPSAGRSGFSNWQYGGGHGGKGDSTKSTYGSALRPNTFGSGGGGGTAGMNKFIMDGSGYSDYRDGLYGTLDFDKIVLILDDLERFSVDWRCSRDIILLQSFVLEQFSYTSRYYLAKAFTKVFHTRVRRSINFKVWLIMWFSLGKSPLAAILAIKG